MSDVEKCALCKHCFPCKELINGKWKWFKVCALFAYGKDGWAITVEDYDRCECFQNREG